MRKVYIVFASIFGGLALIFALAGFVNVVAPDPLYLRTVVRYSGEPDVASMLPYIGGSIMGVGLIGTGIVCAIIANTFINLLIGFRRSVPTPPARPLVGQ